MTLSIELTAVNPEAALSKCRDDLHGRPNGIAR